MPELPSLTRNQFYVICFLKWEIDFQSFWSNALQQFLTLFLSAVGMVSWSYGCNLHNNGQASNKRDFYNNIPTKILHEFSIKIVRVKVFHLQCSFSRPRAFLWAVLWLFKFPLYILHVCLVKTGCIRFTYLKTFWDAWSSSTASTFYLRLTSLFFLPALVHQYMETSQNVLTIMKNACFEKFRSLKNVSRIFPRWPADACTRNIFEVRGTSLKWPTLEWAHSRAWSRQIQAVFWFFDLSRNVFKTPPYFSPSLSSFIFFNTHSEQQNH